MGNIIVTTQPTLKLSAMQKRVAQCILQLPPALAIAVTTAANAITSFFIASRPVPSHRGSEEERPSVKLHTLAHKALLKSFNPLADNKGLTIAQGPHPTEDRGSLERGLGGQIGESCSLLSPQWTTRSAPGFRPALLA